MGAPTSTPNNLEQTATSIVLTTVPTSAYGQPTATLLADVSAADQEIPVTSEQPAITQAFPITLWILGIGIPILLILLYLLSRELKRSTAKNK